MGFIDDGLAFSDQILRAPRPHVIGALATLPQKAATSPDRPEAPEQFEVVLYLAEDVADIDDFDLERVVPATSSTGWLSVDLVDSRITIDPEAAREPTEDILVRPNGTFELLPPLSDGEPETPLRHRRSVVHLRTPEASDPTPPDQLRPGDIRRVRRGGNRRRPAR